MHLEAQSPRHAKFCFFVNRSVKRQKHFYSLSLGRAIPCRYAAQNAKALEEAKTALATGEIRTPSLPSEESSDGGETDQYTAGGEHLETSTQCASSGERYERRSSECSGSESVDSYEEYTGNCSSDVGSESSESSLHTEETTSEETPSHYTSRTEENDNTVTEGSSGSDENTQVGFYNPVILLILHGD